MKLQGFTLLLFCSSIPSIQSRPDSDSHHHPSTSNADSHHHPSTSNADSHSHSHSSSTKPGSHAHNSYTSSSILDNPPSITSGYSGQTSSSSDLTSQLEGLDLTLLDSKLIGLGYVREDLVNEVCEMATDQLIEEGVQRL